MILTEHHYVIRYEGNVKGNKPTMYDAILTYHKIP